MRFIEKLKFKSSKAPVPLAGDGTALARRTQKITDTR